LITFYYNNGPNPMKVALFLEEAGLDYRPVPIETRNGEQFTQEMLALNPNGKVPVIVDSDTQAPIFDSTAILLYLAEKTGRFLPASPEDPRVRGDMLSWLLFVASGVGPFSGQAVHFRHYVAAPDLYSVNRYDYEAERHWKIVDARLQDRPYMLGPSYSIADMSVWGWARMVPHMLADENAWTRFPNIKRLLDEINGRPAAERVRALITGRPFKTGNDPDSQRHLYPQLARLRPA
jgi:GSH-dependent disulfide-bond oxidoreductase